MRKAVPQSIDYGASPAFGVWDLSRTRRPPRSGAFSGYDQLKANIPMTTSMMTAETT